MSEIFGGLYDGGEEETPEETPEEEVVEETMEEKVARLEAEKADLSKREEEALAEKKRLLDERTVFGRRTKEAEDRQIAFERKLAEMESRLASGRSMVSSGVDDIDTTDPETIRRLIREEADNRIAERIRSDDENQRVYSEDYLREVRNLSEGLDAETVRMIDQKLEVIRECHTGNPKADARINFLEAKSKIQEEMLNQSRKPINIRKDTVKGAGVGGGSASDTGRSRGVKLGEEEKKLLSKLGRDDKWASKALT